MSDAFMERADMLVARNLRNAGLAVMKALVDELLLQRLNEHIDQTGTPVPAYLPEKNLYIEGTGHRQVGFYDRYMKIVTTLYLGATAAFFARNEDDIARPLWETLDKQEKEYQAAWRVYRQAAQGRGMRRLTPPFEPTGDFEKDIIPAIGNNVLTIQNELLAHQRLFDSRWQVESNESYAAFMRRTALARTALLTLPGSANRSVTAKILPDPVMTETESGELLCEDPLTMTEAPHSLTRQSDGVDRWDHHGMGTAWPLPGNCVGDILHIPTPAKIADVDTFFEYVSTHAGNERVGRDEQGRYSSILVAHSIGALVAEHTMYQRKVPAGST
jgi:hypothetical protein